MSVNIISLIVIAVSIGLLFKTKISVEDVIQQDEKKIDVSSMDLKDLIKDPIYNEFSYYTQSLNKIKAK